jgi:hypothetical protein
MFYLFILPLVRGYKRFAFFFLKNERDFAYSIIPRLKRSRLTSEERTGTLEKSLSHSPPTPRTAWIPWANLKAPRGPVLMDVWRRSSTNLGSSLALSAFQGINE